MVAAKLANTYKILYNLRKDYVWRRTVTHQLELFVPASGLWPGAWLR
jgi:hypothetical protein